MNTNPSAIKILCYGDSNTWGYIPGTGQRYPVGIRWTSLLQEKLGDGYWIIEEGLNSRTTNLDDPIHNGKNGLTYIVPCLKTHDPIDIIILMLGTNDMKERFNRTPSEIADGIKELLYKIEDTCSQELTKTPQILLLSPPVIDESVEGVEEKYKAAGKKSEQLGALYQQVAKEKQIEFIDLAQYVSPSKKDGYHLEPESHRKITELILSKLQNHFPHISLV